VPIDAPACRHQTARDHQKEAEAAVMLAIWKVALT
jgi:hypothetical protein